VRLAFAAAVYIDPDILIVDEALAVGDLRFQKKCREKMNEFKRLGITIILVSHSMSDISTMCNKAIFLKNGEPAFIGDASDAINAYTYEENKAEMKQVEAVPLYKATELTQDVEAKDLPKEYGGDRGGTRDILIKEVFCYQRGKEKELSEIQFGEDIIIEFTYEAINRIERPVFRVNFSVTGYKFFANIDSTDTGLSIPYIEGKGRAVFEIKRPNLYPQAYKLNIGVTTESINSHLFFWNEAGGFLIRAPKGKNMSYPTAIVELDSVVSLHKT